LLRAPPSVLVPWLPSRRLPPLCATPHRRRRRPCVGAAGWLALRERSSRGGPRQAAERRTRPALKVPELARRPAPVSGAQGAASAWGGGARARRRSRGLPACAVRQERQGLKGWERGFCPPLSTCGAYPGSRMIGDACHSVPGAHSPLRLNRGNCPSGSLTTFMWGPLLADADTLFFPQLVSLFSRPQKLRDKIRHGRDWKLHGASRDGLRCRINEVITPHRAAFPT
jgi:hypothetical protein